MDSNILIPLFPHIKSAPADLFPELIAQAHQDVQGSRRDQGLPPWDFKNRRPMASGTVLCACGCGAALSPKEVAIHRAYLSGHGSKAAQKAALAASGNVRRCQCSPDCQQPLTEKEIATGRVVHHGHGPKANKGNRLPERPAPVATLTHPLCACGCGQPLFSVDIERGRDTLWGHGKKAKALPELPLEDESRPDHEEATDEDFDNAKVTCKRIPVEEVTGVERPAPVVPVKAVTPEEFKHDTGLELPQRPVQRLEPVNGASDPILKAIRAELFDTRRKLKSLIEMETMRLEMLK